MPASVPKDYFADLKNYDELIEQQEDAQSPTEIDYPNLSKKFKTIAEFKNQKFAIEEASYSNTIREIKKLSLSQTAQNLQIIKSQPEPLLHRLLNDSHRLNSLKQTQILILLNYSIKKNWMKVYDTPSIHEFLSKITSPSHLKNLTPTQTSSLVNFLSKSDLKNEDYFMGIQ